MPKPRTKTGEKNLISHQLIELRKQHNYSQRYLSYLLQIIHVSYDYLIDGKEREEQT